MEQDLGALIRTDAVHRSVYTDPAIFDLEMERIFGRTWVFLGHTSEIREAGDYKTTHIGRHPIILSRLSDGGVAALFNRCRHRGATVCQHELGNSRFFRCAYHGWTYASSLTAKGPSLDEHLGGTKTLIDEFCEVSPTGEIEVFPGYQKCAYDGNWKYQVENGVDPYHVQHLHRSTFTEQALKIYSEAKGLVVDMDGHGVTDHRDTGPLPPDGNPSGGFNVVIFPNLVLLRTQIRTIRPISVNRTEIYTNVVRLQNVPEELNIRRLRSQQFEFGPAGVVYADDLEIFERTQEGLQSAAVEWLMFSRGLCREKMHGKYLSSTMSDETQHRGMYRHWKQLMTAAQSSDEASGAAGERVQDGR